MILADENTHTDLIDALRKIPADVLSIKESYRGMQDEEIILLAKTTNRIILTEDKDFGEWVFAHKTKGISVIFLRYHFTETAQIIKIVSAILKVGTEKFYNKFTTITTRKIRSREI
ncbi:MAG: DUF5615 family PIN-like protein [Bacteroidetes bacterium]|nr:DUF5615 family PIN-like protein [Bacteroidota bacterium]